MRARIVKLMRGQRFDRLVAEVADGLYNEVSVLSLLTTYRHLLDLPEDYLYPMTFYLRYVFQDSYSKSVARRKARLLRELAEECREEFGSVNWRGDELVERVRSGVVSAVAGIGLAAGRGTPILRKIMCILLAEDKQYWIRQLGQQLYDKVIASLNCSGDSPKGI